MELVGERIIASSATLQRVVSSFAGFYFIIYAESVRPRVLPDRILTCLASRYIV